MMAMTVADPTVNVGFLRIFRLVPVIALIAAVVTLAAIFKEKPLPRGCGCIPSCAQATTGCNSCPCVPWSVGVLGIIGLILILPGLAWLGEAGAIGIVLVIIIVIQKLLVITVGFLW